MSALLLTHALLRAEPSRQDHDHAPGEPHLTVGGRRGFRLRLRVVRPDGAPLESASHARPRSGRASDRTVRSRWE